MPKPNGNNRFILNLKDLNAYVETSHFKFEDRRTATKLVTPNAFMCSLDLKDAYFLVPVDVENRKLLRFTFHNQIFEFTCLTFGLCTSPFVFTKIMKPVINHLRQQGLISTVYSDDIFCIGDTQEACLRNVQTTRKLLCSLGFLINEEKSSTTPNTKCKYLGFILNSEDMTAELTAKKKESLALLVMQYLKRSKCKIRDFAHLIGSLVATCPGVQYGKLSTKLLERDKFLALSLHDQDYEQDMVITSASKKELQWWKQVIPFAKKPIFQFKFIKEIFSDASLTGWGAHCNGKNANGFWTESERNLHINHLELIAALLALKCFASDNRDCELLLRIDNTTAVAYMNKMGGVQYPKLNNLARDLWQWCEEREIWVFASYIPSSENVDADRESRITNIDTEWELAAFAFEKLVRIFGQPDIDLFASRCNTKVPIFCSWKRIPEAFAIDAFTINWGNSRFYAFPPFALILGVLQKIKTDEASGIVIVPYGPTRPWFPVFMSLAVGNIEVFAPSPRLLLSPCRSLTHPLANHLTLVAGLLCGKSTEGNNFRKAR